MKKKALFSGTFDPFTTGHHALIKRALHIADEIVIAIGVNPGKKTVFPLDERLERIRQIYISESRIQVVAYQTLTIDLAQELGVDFILRGVRNIADFEYEKNMADANRAMSGIETVFLFAEPEYGYVSSSLVHELIHYNKDITHLIP